MVMAVTHYAQPDSIAYTIRHAPAFLSTCGTERGVACLLYTRCVRDMCFLTIDAPY
jgi:hypothetical protein